MALLHVAVSAAGPERVAAFRASRLGGQVLPFPPFPGSWIAFAGPDDGTAIAGYPRTRRPKILSLGRRLGHAAL